MCGGPLDVAPNNGFTQFDNIGSAFLTIFTIVTLENWAQVCCQRAKVARDFGLCEHGIMVSVIAGWLLG